MSAAPWWEELRAAQPEGTARPTRQDPPPLRVERDAQPPQVQPPRARPPRALQAVAAALGLVLVVLLGLLAERSLRPAGPLSPLAAGGPTTAGATARTLPPATPAGASAGRAAAAPAAGVAGGSAADDAAATAELHERRRQGLAAHPPQGQWVAQLSAKSVGTTDPVQTAANGSSTFYAADILAQSEEIASGIPARDVFVLQTTDFGTGLLDARGNPYWVTLVAGPFADAADVQTWCDSMFALTPQGQRTNACLPRRLTPR
ncbi:hypothetical protein [Kineococcus sp. SYSU DK006]|uniref:hypothetical protein n=1 Tax=Kineococcus sp. SYSU DK006 TaxID=3383127 RepID=UPI003D7CFB33